MSIVRTLLGGRASEQRAASLADLQSLLGLGGPSASGRSVSEEGALAQTTVLACVQLIAESVGMLPLILYKRLERGKERAVNHPLYSVLHDLPNPELTTQELLENLTGHLALWGNAYCEIEYDGAGRRRALWPLRPDRMSVAVDAGRNERVYVYELPNGERKALARWRVWHVRGWGTDAWVGQSRIALAREAIGLALATEEYGARWFSNGSRPGGYLRRPVGAPKMTDERLGKLREQVQALHGGLANSHRIAVLEEGMEWQQVGVPPEDAQFLETRSFQESQICQIYRVPPHMIGITDKATSWGTGIGQQTEGFKAFTMQPYLSRFAQTIGRDLLTASERGTYFAEFMTNALVRNDLGARYNAYSVGRNGGWLSVNDIRELENMNPVDEGDGYLQPLNMTPLGAEPEPAPAAEEDKDDGEATD